MPYYKDTENKLHFLGPADVAFEHLLPAGSVQITDEEAEAIQNPAPTAADLIAQFEAALDAHLDATARADRWDSRYTYALRASYPNIWRAQAEAFVEWMDGCNALAYQLLLDVEAGKKKAPKTVEEFIGALPAFVKP